MNIFTEDSLKHYLENIWKDAKSLAKLFRTDSGGYLYDTGTNKILACRDEVFDLLHLLLNHKIDDAITAFTGKYGREEFPAAAEEIVSAMKQENILLTLIANFRHFGLKIH